MLRVAPNLHIAQISLDGRVSPGGGGGTQVPEGLTDRTARLRSRVVDLNTLRFRRQPQVVQSDEKSDGAICAPDLISASLAYLDEMCDVALEISPQ